jgi:hypothetical protein
MIPAPFLRVLGVGIVRHAQSKSYPDQARGLLALVTLALQALPVLMPGDLAPALLDD